jgi:hypothetical protein
MMEAGAREAADPPNLPGIVTRITRTDYVVQFQICGAHTGAVILKQSSDLRIGADYSWFRGARALIRDHLLDGS